MDLDKWLKDKDGLGLRIRSEDLKDFLGLNIFSSGSLEIPEGTVGLVLRPEGRRQLCKPGQEVSGDFDLYLIKDRRLKVDLSVTGLRSSDDFPFDFSAELDISVDCLSEDAVADFGETFLASRNSVTEASLRRFLKPHVEEALRGWAVDETAEALGRGDRSVDVEKVIRSRLKRVFFENGFDLDDVNEVQLESQAFAQVREERLGATIEEERAKRLEIIRQAWVKDQKNEAMSEKEVKEFVKALEHEGALKEIERRRQKAEAERELHAILEEKEQARLERELKNASQVMELLENAGFKNVFEKFLDMAEKRSGSHTGDDLRRAQAHGIRNRVTHRLLAVSGARILVFDPARPAQDPAEVLDFTGRGLGLLRSVRTDDADATTVLLVGAQRGVYVKVPEGDDTVRALGVPGAGDKRGGVNAAVVAGDRVLATHSDYGILSWPLAGGEGEVVRPDLTRGESTVRGIRRGPADTYYFAAGRRVFSLLGPDLEGTPTVYEGADASITALWVTKAAVFAGTKSGELLRWRLGEPASPRREIAKGVDPIYMIKTALIDKRPSLLVGWKGYGVLAKVLETDSQVQFLSDARIRWVDGESRYVFGVDRDGRRILVWRTEDKTARHREYVTEDRIQDIWAWPREEEAGEAP